MIEKNFNQRGNYYNLLCDIHMLIKKGQTLESIKFSELCKRHGVGAMPKSILDKIDLTAEPTIETALRINTIRREYDLARRKARENGSQGESLTKVATTTETILPFMTDAEMIAHLHNNGYRVFKEI